MTEAEWLTTTDPAPLLQWVQDEVSERKLRLFFCGCCRHVWALLTDGRSRSLVETVERYVDGKASTTELQLSRDLARRAQEKFHNIAHRRLEEARGKLRHHVSEAYRYAGAAEAAYMIAWDTPRIYPYPWETDCGGGLYDALSIGESRASYDAIFRERGDICRCVFGNPFRSVSVDPAWRTSTVMALARGIYDERAFERMPILADALQDAGCESDDSLNHLRDPEATHVRGCWALDLVLGKE